MKTRKVNIYLEMLFFLNDLPLLFNVPPIPCFVEHELNEVRVGYDSIHNKHLNSGLTF